MKYGTANKHTDERKSPYKLYTLHQARLPESGDLEIIRSVAEACTEILAEEWHHHLH